MVAYNVISADPHIVEPPDIYTNYIEPKYRDRAPSIERRRTRWGQAYDAWCDEGNRVGTVMHDLAVLNRCLARRRRHRTWTEKKRGDRSRGCRQPLVGDSA
jgi:hypothetical protein